MFIAHTGSSINKYQLFILTSYYAINWGSSINILLGKLRTRKGFLEKKA